MMLHQVFDVLLADYDSYNVEVEIPSQFIRRIALIYLVVAAWTRYHNGKCLNRDFLFDYVQEYFVESMSGATLDTSNCSLNRMM